MYCPKCGAAIVDGCSFCIKCGEKIDIASSENPTKSSNGTTKSSKKKTAIKIVTTLAAVLAICFVLYAVFNGGQKEIRFANIPPETDLATAAQLVDKEFGEQSWYINEDGRSVQYTDFQGIEGLTATIIMLPDDSGNLGQVLFVLDNDDISELADEVIEKLTQMYGESHVADPCLKWEDEEVTLLAVEDTNLNLVYIYSGEQQ